MPDETILKALKTLHTEAKIQRQLLAQVLSILSEEDVSQEEDCDEEEILEPQVPAPQSHKRAAEQEIDQEVPRVFKTQRVARKSPNSNQ